MNNMTIEELKNKRTELWNQYHELGTKIRKLEIENCNYEGKYIFIQEYGYMYVTWQHYDENSLYGDERMFFQGFGFNRYITDYRDDFWIDADAMVQWNIPIDTFQRYVKDDKIKVMEKQEFLDVLNSTIQEFQKEYPSMLEYCEKEVSDKKE